VLAEHALVGPGETSILDAHYDRPRADRPNRAPRPRTQTEKDFCALGPVAEAFLVGAAAAGVSKLGGELADIVALKAAHGEAALLAALQRAVTYPAVVGRRHPLHPGRRWQSTHPTTGWGTARAGVDPAAGADPVAE
jgi:hypothetical protein